MGSFEEHVGVSLGYVQGYVEDSFGSCWGQWQNDHADGWWQNHIGECSRGPGGVDKGDLYV